MMDTLSNTVHRAMTTLGAVIEAQSGYEREQRLVEEVRRLRAALADLAAVDPVWDADETYPARTGSYCLYCAGPVAAATGALLHEAACPWRVACELLAPKETP